MKTNVDKAPLQVAVTRILTFVGLLSVLNACDTAYRYVFFPPERIEYTLVPDADLLQLANDTSYAISRDSLSIIYDRKSFKIEVKYLSDYQLNTFDFPEDSKDGLYSANPFTYGNWVDPDLGYTPNRFTVFKISIFNYTMSKINFDPERSFLVTDRGDLFAGYGREEKSSRNQSLEAYFRKRKGSSGVDDEVFERRMGIIRTTVLYLGRPIYQGDSREGLVVYDPLHESVQKVKLVLDDVIIGYDENNEPSDFLDLQFFFRRKPLMREELGPAMTASDTGTVAGNTVLPQRIELHRVRYRVEGEEEGVQREDWNAKPRALHTLAKFIADSLKIEAVIKNTPADSPDLLSARVAFLLGGPGKPILTDVEITALANLIRRGGFLVFDNAAFPSTYNFFSSMEQLLESIASKLDREARVVTVPTDHDLYRAWHRILTLPPGMDDLENLPERRTFLQGLFWRNRLVAVLSSKGYSMMWDATDPRFTDQLILGTNIITYALRTSRTR